MHTCRCYIIPPHMLKHLADTAGPAAKAAAQATLLTTRALRTQRELLGVLGARRMPAGQKRRTVYDAKQGDDLPGTLVRSEGGAPSASKAINEAYDGAGITYDFYKLILHRNSIDDRGMRLDSTVNFREEQGIGYDNAFWNGDQMVYGEGDGELFGSFTSSLDVIGHELTHGVTQYEAELAYRGESGALNESFSDVFGVLVKQWHLKQTVDEADWLIGAELLINIKSGSDARAALRSLKAPGTAYKDDQLGDDPQPAHMKDYKKLPNSAAGDNGGVHINSGIPNRAFYLACKNLGAKHAWEKGAPIWYATLRALHKTSKFADAAKMSVAMAQQQFDAMAAKAVTEAWSEVGVNVGPVVVHVAPMLAMVPPSANDAEAVPMPPQIPLDAIPAPAPQDRADELVPLPPVPPVA